MAQAEAGAVRDAKDPERIQWRRIVAGSRRDFDRLFDTYQPRVYAYCLRRLRTREAAETATRRIFLDLARALHQEPPDSVLAWIFRRTRREVARRPRRIPVRSR